MPEFKFGTDAESRRIRFVHFGKVYKGKDRDLLLKRKLAPELDDILSMLVRRLPRICKLNELGKGSILSRRTTRYFGVRNSIIENFLADCMEECSISISRDRREIYRCFERYCQSHNEDVRLNVWQFTREVKKLHPEIDMNYKVRCGGNSYVRAWRGYKFSELGGTLLRDTSTKGSRLADVF
jgi:phage/plasmid-associated DNA primase